MKRSLKIDSLNRIGLNQPVVSAANKRHRLSSGIPSSSNSTVSSEVSKKVRDQITCPLLTRHVEFRIGALYYQIWNRIHYAIADGFSVTGSRLSGVRWRGLRFHTTCPPLSSKAPTSPSRPVASKQFRKSAGGQQPLLCKVRPPYLNYFSSNPQQLLLKLKTQKSLQILWCFSSKSKRFRRIDKKSL